jgi:LysR family hydrogen peroxide-inducible transcriptional activator
VVLAWRKSFTRQAAVDAISQAVLRCALPGVGKLDVPPRAG